MFGDSLSDNGNLAAALGTTFPNPPSYHDSFTNGPVSVQLLAQSLGLSLNPSLWTTAPAAPAGTNYAVAGATSSPMASHGDPAISLPEQVGAFSFYSGGAADQNALYVIMIGGNDVRDAALYQTGTDATDAITAGVKTEVDEIKALSGEGAKDFLVVNVPNVGLIPEFTLENPGDAANATAYSISYDSQLSAGLEGLGLPKGDQLTDFNLFAFNANILENAGSYGFTNLTQPCFADTPFSAVSTTGCVPDGPDANIVDLSLLGPHPSDGRRAGPVGRRFPGGHSRAFDLVDVAARLRGNGLCGICKLAKSERGLSAVDRGAVARLAARTPHPAARSARPPSPASGEGVTSGRAPRARARQGRLRGRRTGRAGGARDNRRGPWCSWRVRRRA